MNLGDHIILMNGSAHTLSGVSGEAPVSFVCFSTNSRDSVPDSEESKLSARVLYGHFDIQPFELGQLTQCLPATALVSSNSCKEKELEIMAPVLDFVCFESNSPAPGSAAVVKRALQLLFLQTLRTFIVANTRSADCSLDHIGSQAFVTLDSRFGLLIQLIHAEPEKNWTVATMARRAKMSKSTFSERFRKAIGQPPIEYLTIVRMRKACDLLRSTGLPIKRIARLVGYESESAFSNAFKRRIGEPPIAYRRLS